MFIPDLDPESATLLETNCSVRAYVLRIRDVYLGSEFFPSRIRIPDPALDFLYPFRIQGSKRHRIPNPGSGFATLLGHPNVLSSCLWVRRQLWPPPCDGRSVSAQSDSSTRLKQQVCIYRRLDDRFFSANSPHSSEYFYFAEYGSASKRRPNLVNLHGLELPKKIDNMRVQMDFSTQICSALWMSLSATKLAVFFKDNFWDLYSWKEIRSQNRNRIKWKTDQDLITTLQHCSGSVTFWYGSRSSDP